jgi:uncharacterized protein YnzC (UPF0291/DUF896 family)
MQETQLPPANQETGGDAMLSPEKMARIGALNDVKNQRPLTTAESAELESLMAGYRKSVTKDFHQVTEGIKWPFPIKNDHKSG